MSVLSPTEGEIFRVEIRKALSSNPSATWVNTYEITGLWMGGSPGAFLGTAELDETAQAIVAWERQWHFTGVIFTRYVVSTWLSDSEPYNGDEFLAVPLALNGTRIAPGEILGLNQCLYFERQPVGGRTGKLYLRGCLSEPDVTAVAGQSNLVEDFREALNGALTDADGPGNLGVILNSFHNAQLVMAGRNSADAVVVRRVTNLIASDRVVTKKTDNRWFNRSA